MRSKSAPAPAAAVPAAPSPVAPAPTALAAAAARPDTGTDGGTGTDPAPPSPSAANSELNSSIIKLASRSMRSSLPSAPAPAPAIAPTVFLMSEPSPSSSRASPTRSLLSTWASTWADTEMPLFCAARSFCRLCRPIDERSTICCTCAMEALLILCVEATSSLSSATQSLTIAKKSAANCGSPSSTASSKSGNIPKTAAAVCSTLRSILVLSVSCCLHSEAPCRTSAATSGMSRYEACTSSKHVAMQRCRCSKGASCNCWSPPARGLGSSVLTTIACSSTGVPEAVIPAGPYPYPSYPCPACPCA
mmetsp:Transcript_33789/g.74411  ORF Transcript_33789/g.74411 Transcript_33789/m.74411 type:complete len:305 (+) Transcript_33789:880-1794(+)